VTMNAWFHVKPGPYGAGVSFVTFSENSRLNLTGLNEKARSQKVIARGDGINDFAEVRTDRD